MPAERSAGPSAGSGARDPGLGGRITRVTGWNTPEGGRGLPKVSEIEVTHDDGRVVHAKLRALQGKGAETAQLVRAISRARFRKCPICLEGPGETKEHVPPRQLGGVVMTYTCKACNGGLGSRTESALMDWFDDAFRIFYTRDGDQAPFGHDRVLFRRTEAGEFVLLHEKGTDRVADTFRDKMKPGVKLLSHQAWPHPAQYRTGLLKNAYLAACLSLGGVPLVESADEIRAELLAARDARSRANVTLGDRARNLRCYRTGSVASGPHLALVRAGRDDETVYLLSLAGTVLVSWPFPEIPPIVQVEGEPEELTAASEGVPRR